MVAFKDLWYRPAANNSTQYPRIAPYALTNMQEMRLPDHGRRHGDTTPTFDHTATKLLMEWFSWPGYDCNYRRPGKSGSGR